MRKKGWMVLFLLLSILVYSTSLQENTKIYPLQELAKPQFIETDGNNLYIIEGSSIFVYSLKDFSFQGKFGQKGSGPGEFETNEYIVLRMVPVQGNLFFYTNYKMGVFTPLGKMITENKFPFFAFRIMPIKDNFAVTKTFLGEDGKNKLAVVIMNSDFEILSTPYQRDYMDYTRMKSFSLLPDFIYTRVFDNKLYVFDNKGDFTIHVFDSLGKSVKTISLNYPKIKVTGERKSEIMEVMEKTTMFKSMPDNYRKMMVLPDYFPIVRDFVVKGQRIYVLTYNHREEKAEFVILDLNGKELKRLFMTLPQEAINPLIPIPFTFHDDNYLYLEENVDTEKWELHMEKIF